MFCSTSGIRFVSQVSLVVLLSIVPVLAESAENKFHRAFYLEQGGGDWAAACKLYSEVTSDTAASADLKAKAQARLAACREELASRDLASLMPSDTLVYAELQRPGDQVLKLLEKLGLLAGDKPLAAKNGKRLAISPSLIRELLGVGGAAVALTGFNPMQMAPTGVIVFHPGDLEVIRGFIETGLPVGAETVEPIRGYATYKVENQAIVTLTARLVVVGNDRGQIDGVLRRLSGEETKSLATNPRLAEAIKDRGDSLLFFSVDAKSLMPYVTGMAAATGAPARELAMVQAVLDPNSLQSVVGRLGVSDDGAFLSVAIRLEKGHHNLVYNFFRTAPINRDTLKCVPEGAAAFIVAAINEPSSRFAPAGSGKPEGAPVVTALDFGREIFANITSLAVFALPSTDEPAAGPSCVPDVAAAITVNDPSKSEALWRQILGIASLATGAPTIEGSAVQIEGREVRSYRFPENIVVHFATLDNDVLVAMTPAAMARTIKAKRSGASVLKDNAYAASLNRLGPDATRAVFVHPGRCFGVAKHFMPSQDAAEMEPFLPVLSDTVVSVVFEHSAEMLRMTGLVSGIPNVSDMVAEAIQKETAGKRGGERVARAATETKNTEGKAEGKRQEAKEKAKEPAVETKKAESKDQGDVVSKFKSIAAGGDGNETASYAEDVFRQLRNDAKALNNLAWELLTEGEYKGQFNEFALRLAERSNELSDYASWYFMDTLALAKFKAGQIEEAIKLQKKVIQMSKGEAADELKGRLAQYEAAAGKRNPGSD